MAEPVFFERRVFQAIKKLMNNSIPTDERTLEGNLRDALRIAVLTLVREDHSIREEVRKILKAEG